MTCGLLLNETITSCHLTILEISLAHIFALNHFISSLSKLNLLPSPTSVVPIPLLFGCRPHHCYSCGQKIGFDRFASFHWQGFVKFTSKTLLMLWIVNQIVN